jgi:hypothetical protein
MTRPLYQILASLVCEYELCVARGQDRAEKVRSKIEKLVQDYMPQDPEVGRPYQLHLDRSNGYCLMFTVDIRGRTHHFVIKPSLRESFRMLAVGPNLSARHHNAAREALLQPQEEVLV